jgi:hypothetical protein
MEFNYIADGIDAVVIDNFYSEEQLNEIMIELKFLTKPSIMVDDKHKLGTAIDSDGDSLTRKSGVWVDQVFRNWRNSSLISYPMQNLANKEVSDKLIEFNSLFRILHHCNTRAHLLSYYENSEYYKTHRDIAVFTVLSYFYNEPKKFKGGDVTLHSSTSDKKATVETRNNRIIIIPSCTLHEVSTIEMSSNKLSGDGRYCCSIFLNITDQRQNNDSN